MGATLSPTPGLSERYVIERELGRGGMATVYLAEERKHGRKVAIKVLRPELAASMGAERFLREIGIAARLAHPHIVPLIDSGDAAGTLYYVSAYVPDGSLRDRLARTNRLAVGEALRIAEEVGAALDYAHRAGFVHRDVKPENILFADDHALLADFGIARASCPSDGDGVTEAGIAVGTPAYMSPEQASGERALDGRSDIYSLGCVLYEMLAGVPPLRGGTARATIARQVTEQPAPLRTLRPDAPAALEEALARALAKDPAQRFAHVAEFIAAARAEPPVRGRLPQTAMRSLAVLPFVNVSPDAENEYLSDGITDELIDALAKVPGLRVASRTSVFALKGTLRDVRALGALLGASVVLEGTVRRAGAQLRVTAQLTSTDDGRLLWSQRYDRQLADVLAMQDEIARTIVNTLRASWFADHTEPAHLQRQTANPRAYALYLRGRWSCNKRTQADLAEGIRYYEQAIAEDPEYALAYTGLADAYALQLDYRSVPVAEGFAHAKQYARRAIALDDSLAEAHASLAWSLFIHDWDWAGAEREFLRAIELNPRYFAAHQWYALLLAALGKTQESLVEGHTAQELDPGSVSARRGLAWLYYYARRFEQTQYHLARAIEMNPMAQETYWVQGLTLSIMGDHAAAVRVLREAVTMEDAGTYTQATLAFALARGGERREAEQLLREVEAVAGRSYVSPVSLATAHLGLGNTTAALDFAQRALDERRGWLVYLRVNPIFDSLRAEPRFEGLAARMGL